jgi:hypothetical protein
LGLRIMQQDQSKAFCEPSRKCRELGANRKKKRGRIVSIAAAPKWKNLLPGL